MDPAASVCGLYFANPQSKYFAVGKIDKDQVDYIQRFIELSKGFSILNLNTSKGLKFR